MPTLIKLPAAELVFSMDGAYATLISHIDEMYPNANPVLAQLMFSWPNLSGIIRRLTFLVSPGLVSPIAPNSPVLASSIAAAANKCARFEDAFCRALPPFFWTLIREIADKLAGLSIAGMTATETDIWDINGISDASPICLWACGYDEIVISRTRTREQTRAAIEFLICGRVLTARDAELLLVDRISLSALSGV